MSTHATSLQHDPATLAPLRTGIALSVPFLGFMNSLFHGLDFTAAEGYAVYMGRFSSRP